GLAEFARRREWPVVELPIADPESAEGAVVEYTTVHIVGAKEQVQGAIHEAAGRRVQVQVAAAIQENSQALAATGDGNVVPFVVDLDWRPAKPDPIVLSGVGKVNVHPLVLNSQHPPVRARDFRPNARVGGEGPGLIADEVLNTLAELDPHLDGECAV